MTDRELVYRIVFDVFADGEMADVAYHNALSSYSDSSGINPGHIKRLSYGVIERAITLDAIISRISGSINLIRMSLFFSRWRSMRSCIWILSLDMRQSMR